MTLKLPLFSVNGVLGAAISPLDRGFAYGDGVFETCRIHRGKIPLWSFHLDRLLQGAMRLGIPVAIDLLEEYRDQLLIQGQAEIQNAGVLKIILTRGVGGRGYKMPDEVQPTYCLGLYSGADLHSKQYLEGVRLRVCNHRLARNSLLAGMKHLNRLEYILARNEWCDEVDEGLLLDTEGQVIEATVSNLFAVVDGCLITPDLTYAGVSGIMRRLIIEQLAPALKLQTRVEHIDLNIVSAADELFLCNSVFGVWPVKTLLLESPLNLALGPVTLAVQVSLERYLQP